MIKVKSFKDGVRLLKIFGRVLRPFTYPRVSPEVEVKITPYKTWEFQIDGYDVCISYTEFEIDENIASNVQIFSKHLISLPFHVVFKIGSAFLGLEKIVYFNFFKDGRQVCCWTCLMDMNGNKLSYNKEIRTEKYLNYEFACLFE